MTDRMIELLTAQREIEAMRIAYMDAVDSVDPDNLKTPEFFLPDAKLEHIGLFHYEGMDEILAGQRERFKQRRLAGQHFITNTLMDIDLDKGEARVKSHFVYLQQAESGPRIHSAGHHRDLIVRDESGRWWIKERTIQTRLSSTQNRPS